MDAAFVLSIFGDEIAADLETQIAVMQRLNLHALALRTAWGVNVRDLAGETLENAAALITANAITVSCLASAVGKTPITAPLDDELAALEALFAVGRRLDAHRIRVFSFYPPAGTSADDYLDEAAARLRTLTARAAEAGFTLLLENDKGLVGDTPARCQALLNAVGSPHLRFAWDGGNFVEVGVARPTESVWPLLGAYLGVVHIKDVDSARRLCLPGQGSAQLPALLARLAESGYRGYLAVEPHLVVAGKSGGFSGVDGATDAVAALRALLAADGYRELPHLPPAA